MSPKAKRYSASSKAKRIVLLNQTPFEFLFEKISENNAILFVFDEVNRINPSILFDSRTLRCSSPIAKICNLAVFQEKSDIRTAQLTSAPLWTCPNRAASFSMRMRNPSVRRSHIATISFLTNKRFWFDYFTDRVHHNHRCSVRVFCRVGAFEKTRNWS